MSLRNGGDAGMGRLVQDSGDGEKEMPAIRSRQATGMVATRSSGCSAGDDYTSASLARAANAGGRATKRTTARAHGLGA